MTRNILMEMEEDIPGLKGLLRSLAEEAQARAGAHLDSETLVAYHSKQLSADESSRTQDHLVTCRECTSLLLDLAELCAPEEAEPSRPSQAESEAGWARLQPLFQTAPQAPLSLFQRIRELVFPLRSIHALAALSLVLSLSLAFWIMSLKRENQELLAQVSQRQNARDAEAAKEIEEAQRQRDEARAQARQLEEQADRSRREIDELTKPQLNAPIIDLPLGETRSQGASRPVIEIPAGAARFTVVIPAPASERNYPDYAIEILNQSGAPVVNERGLRPDPESGFTITLPRRLFPAGEYRFNVYGLGRGGRVRVSGDIVRIRYK